MAKMGPTLLEKNTAGQEIKQRNIVRTIPKASTLINPKASLRFRPPFYCDLSCTKKVDLKNLELVNLVNWTRKIAMRM